MELECVFDASGEAYKKRRVQSDELETSAEAQMPGSQPRHCALKRWESRERCNPNTRRAQVRAHLLSLPQLEIC